MIKLGQKCRDTVTGFEGICIARTEWLNGCIRVVVQPKMDKDGKIPEAPTFDEPQLVAIEGGIPEGKHDTGGPVPSPVRHPGAVR